MQKAEARIGVIGGSGLYQIEGMSNVRDVKLKTPFGDPSDAITVGDLDGVRLAFLPRHGKGHRILPSEVPVQANIYALKSLGVERIIAVNAVGSLKEDFRPLDIVVPDQLIDRTRSRVNTFFGNGVVVHIAFADPFCPELSQVLFNASKEVAPRVHRGCTYVVIEGPAFSTRAESQIYRSWGADVIGMTQLPEAKLAREAEICYASLSCVTDYDCWREDCESVSVEMVVANLQKNAENAKKIIRKAAKSIPSERGCSCARALENAIITSPEAIPAQAKRDLGLLLGKYVH